MFVVFIIKLFAICLFLKINRNNIKRLGLQVCLSSFVEFTLIQVVDVRAASDVEATTAVIFSTILKDTINLFRNRHLQFFIHLYRKSFSMLKGLKVQKLYLNL